MDKTKESQQRVFEVSETDVAGVLVACPIIKGDLRSVVECFGCEHYANLHDRFPNDTKLEFHKRYMVGCRYPRAQQLFKVRTRDASPK